MQRVLSSNPVFIALLILFGALLYFNNLHVPFVYDDLQVIKGNPRLQNPTSISDAVITDFRTNRTFQNLTFTINWALTPDSPVSFHIFNNLLHISNAVLLFLFLSNFTLARYLPHLTSIFFLVHPLQIQSVTYIMGRISLLQTFITIIILLLFSNPKTRRPLLIFALLCLSVTIKETCALIPVLLLAYDLFINGKPYRDVFWKEHALYFSHIFVALVYHINLDVLGYNEGSVGFGLYPFFEYAIVQAHYLTFYLYLFINPAIQSVYHGYVDPAGLIYASAAIGFLLTLCAMVFITYRVKTDSRPSVHAFFLVFFLVSFLPTNSILQMYNPFAEYRLYQSNIVLCLYLSLVVLTAGSYRRLYAHVIAGMCTAYFMFFTYSHNMFWRDPLVIWKQAHLDYPNSYTVLSNLGSIYVEREEYLKALEHFREAGRWTRTYGERDGAAKKVAYMYHKTGQLTEAAELYEYLYANRNFEKNAVFLQNYALLTFQLGHFEKYDLLLSEIRGSLGQDYVDEVTTRVNSIEHRLEGGPHQPR